MHSAFDTTSDSISGASCARSGLPPLVRFGIFFGVLFSIKYALPHTGLSAALQVIVLACTATFLVWRLWWGCGQGRRGGILVLSVFWLAAFAKIIMQL